MIRMLILLFFFAGLFFKTHATHIVGGEFTYQWVSGNIFKLRLTLYRDCNGTAPFDNTIVIGVFDRQTDQLTDSMEMQLTSTDSLHLAGSLCSQPPEICVESGTYVKNISLPDNPNGYYLSWERCCRNHTVMNIISPGFTGIVFYMEMPNPVLQNSSPVFQNDPLPYMCEGQPFSYNFGGFDPDGDSLAFELIAPSFGHSSQLSPILPAPLPGPYTNAAFQPPYSLNDICGGTPLTIDPVTGEMTAIPNLAGIFAMSVMVREFRNGIQIGQVRREIEFTVILCDDNTEPDVISQTSGPQPGIKNFDIYESDTVCFNIQATDPEDSLYITFSGDCFSGSGISPPFAITADTIGFLHATTSFCWFTGCGQARIDPYKVNYEVKDNGCPLPFVVNYEITIRVKPVPLIEPLNFLCASMSGGNIVNAYWSDTSHDARFLSYFLIYRSVNGGNYQLFDTLYSKSKGYFTDSTAFGYDNNNYCYFIQAVNTCGETGLNSDTLCTDQAKNEIPNYIESVTVAGNNSIELRIEHFPDAPFATFYIYRKENNTASAYTHYQTVQGIFNDTWTDFQVSTKEHSYCYYVINQDACGNISPASNEACSILLNGTTSPFVNSLHWTEYIQWKGGVFDYEIYRKNDGTGNFIKLKNVEYLVFDLDDHDLDYDFGKHIYLVKANEGPGGNQAESYSNEVELTQPPLIFAPNAFTPNNDYSNEIWEVATVFIKDYHLRIFNRYGELIFSSTNKNEGWDGTFHGQKAPMGVYVYDVRYNSYHKEKESRKTGTITLLR